MVDLKNQNKNHLNLLLNFLNYDFIINILVLTLKD